MKQIVATAMVFLTACLTAVCQTQLGQAQPQSPINARDNRSKPVATTEEVPGLRIESRQVLLGAVVLKHSADKHVSDESLLPADVLKRYPRYVVAELTDYAKKLDNRLEASDFRVFDDGTEQRINYFNKSILPLEDWDRLWWFTPTSHGTWGFPPLDGQHAIQPPLVRYVIGYVPPALEPGKCREVRVAVEGREVHLDRNAYCAADRSDNVEEATREGADIATKMRVFANSDAPGSVKVSAQAFAFWSSRVLSVVPQNVSSPGTALPTSDLIYVLQIHHSKAPATVHVAVQFVPPWRLWDPNCPQKPSLSVLGIAYGEHHQIAGQFGVTLTCSAHPAIETYPALQGTILGQKLKVPTRFDAQMELMPGDYDVRVVVSGGKKEFGKTRAPVHVEGLDAQRFAISDVVLSSSTRDASKVLDDAVKVSPAVVIPAPLISKNVQFIPDIQTLIPQHTRLPLYFEIYEPLLKEEAAEVYMHLRVTNLRTGSLVLDSGQLSAADWVLPGNPVIPVGFSMGTQELPRGDYRVEVQASDTAGRESAWRQAKFTID